MAGTREGKSTHVDVGDAMTGVLSMAHDEFYMGSVSSGRPNKLWWCALQSLNVEVTAIRRLALRQRCQVVQQKT
jgi:hypothetical protein